MPFELLSTIEAGTWGLIGGFIVEALEYAAAIRRAKGWPWKRRGEPGLGPQLVAILLRLAASTGLAAAAGAAGQLASVFGALVIGVTTPIMVERILRQAGTVPIELAPSPQAFEQETLPARESSESSDAS